MNDSQTIDSWDDLLASMETAVSHPTDTAWNIFRYLQKNIRRWARSRLAPCLPHI